MRTALLLSGNPRFSEDFDSQIYNLKNSDVYWYLVLWKRNPGEDPKISDNWYVKNGGEIREKLTPYLPPNHRIKFAEVLDPKDLVRIPREYEPFNSTPHNVWQQYKILQYCDHWRRSLDSYDLVIRSRPDIGLSEPIDLKLAHDCLCKDSKVIYTPNNQRYGYIVNNGGYNTGFCDQFAIGLPHVISYYCDAVDMFDSLYEEGIKYNPEYLVQTALLKQGIIWPPTSFEIVRDIRHYVPIKHGKWGEI